MNKPSKTRTSESPNPAQDGQRSGTKQPPTKQSRDRDLLTKDEAASGGPADYSVTGEEDPGAGLEALVRRDQ